MKYLRVVPKKPPAASVDSQKHKIAEEFEELLEAIKLESEERQASEAIDLIQTCVNYIDLLGVDTKELMDQHIEKMNNRMKEWYGPYLTKFYRSLKKELGKEPTLEQMIDNTMINDDQIFYKCWDGYSDFKSVANES